MTYPPQDDAPNHVLRRRTFLSIPLAVAAVGIAGCDFGTSSQPDISSPSSSGESSSPSKSSTNGKASTSVHQSSSSSAEGENSVFRQASRPVTHLNPAFTGRGSPQGDIIPGMMWEGLVNRDPNSTQKYLPGAAKSWEVSDDGLIYTFHLQENLKWSNGEPLTADDFVWTFSYYYSPDLVKQGNQYRPTFSGSVDDTKIEGLPDYFAGKTTDFSTVGIKAVDKQTLKFTLTEPDFRFLDEKVHTYPLHQKSVEAHPKDFWLPDNFVGNGPYTLTVYNQNSSASLERNPHHWDAADFKIQKRTIQFNSSGSTAMMVSYNADEIDLFRVDGDPTALIAGRPDLQKQLLRATPIQYKGMSVLPCKNTILQDNQKLRQALAMSLDREALAKVSPPDMAGPSWAPPGITGADELPKIPFDPDQAKQLLSDAGFADGKGVPTLSILTYATMPVLEAVASMWKKYLNVTAKVAVKEVGVFHNMAHGDLPDDFVGFGFNYQAINPVKMLTLCGPTFGPARYTFVSNSAAQTYFDLTEGKDKNKYSGAEQAEQLSKLLEGSWLPEFRNFRDLAQQALAAQGDAQQAQQLAIKAATALQETYLYIPLLWTGYTFMVKPRVKNLTLSSIPDSMFTLNGVTLDS